MVDATLPSVPAALAVLSATPRSHADSLGSLGPSLGIRAIAAATLSVPPLEHLSLRDSIFLADSSRSSRTSAALAREYPACLRAARSSAAAPATCAAACEVPSWIA